jgi:hypothetical protein
MARYVIQAEHEPEECLALLDSILRAGAHYLTNTDWGCQDGVHGAWMIVEAESEHEARLMIPPVFRSRALLCALNKFTPEQIRQFHEEATAQQ